MIIIILSNYFGFIFSRRHEVLVQHELSGSRYLAELHGISFRPLAMILGNASLDMLYIRIPKLYYLEYIPLGTLQKLAQDVAHDLSFKLAVRILLDIANGILAMHRNILLSHERMKYLTLSMLEKGYLHRDLKTPNVMIASLNPAAPVCAKVIDFGTAVKLDGESVNVTL